MRNSQFGEDKVLEAVIAEIGEGSKVFCDIGARLRCSNAAYWITERGWAATLVEKSGPHCNELERVFADYPAVEVVNRHATMENVNELVPDNTQILSIDIDSDDWWLWANLYVAPPVVIIETNPLPGRYVPVYPCNGGGGYGASVQSVMDLGEMKGYDYLGRTAANAVFVRRELECRYRLPEQKMHAGKKCEPIRSAF